MQAERWERLTLRGRWHWLGTDVLLQKFDVSNGLVWRFPYKGQVSLQGLVRVGDSITIFKARQQLGARRNEDKRASSFIIRHFASLKQKAHEIPAAPHCHCKTKHGTRRDLCCSSQVNFLWWNFHRRLWNQKKTLSKKKKKKPTTQHPTTFALTICVGCAGYRVPDYSFVVRNCTGSWLESSSPFITTLTTLH